jgi:hypothetical protein
VPSPSSPNAAVRRFNTLRAVSLVAKLAGLAVFIVVVLWLWGGL